jgi:hypothetical protein
MMFMEITTSFSTSEQAKALKALRADRLGYFLMGLSLGSCMIAVALWGYWTFDKPKDPWPHKYWVLLVTLGIAFVRGGFLVWKNKSLEICDLEHEMNGTAKCQ